MAGCEKRVCFSYSGSNRREHSFGNVHSMLPCGSSNGHFSPKTASRIVKFP